MPNIYFELTDAFNAKQPVVALTSGQAVVYYRIAIMSKDGDWVIRETPEACATVEECRAAGIDMLPLRGGHDRMVEIGDRVLPVAPTSGSPDADAQ